MRKSKKTSKQPEQIRISNPVPAKIEPLRPKTEQPDKLYNDLAKFPEENPYPVMRIHKDGTVLYANKASEPLLKAKGSRVGKPAPSEWHQLAKKALSSGQVIRELTEHNGRVFALRAVPIPENDYVNFYGTDITEQKMAEEERELMIELLSLINSNNQLHELMKLVTVLLKDWSGCEAVGIRLQDGEDFPYFETSGFPEEFILAENKLCSVNEMGELVRDSQGRPFLECMCGNIISGRFDPSKPFFTKHGSFWTNSTTELLAGTTNADRLTKTRNRCNTAGYESLALIPLRAVEETFGLLQFNSKQKDLFSPEKVSLLERLADNLAIGLAQRRAEQALKKSNHLLRDTGEMAKVGGWELDLLTKEVFCTEETCRIHGVEPGYKPKLGEALNFYAPESRPALEAVLKKAAETGEPYDIESLFIPSGSKDTIWVRSLGRAVYSGGKIVKLAGTFQNIDKYKRAEEALRKSERHYRMLAETMNDGLGEIDESGRYVYANRKLGEILGFSSDKMLGRHWSEFYDRDAQEIIEAQLIARREGLSEPYEFATTRKDGRKIHIRVSPQAISDAHGKFKGSLAIFTDITERKRAEEDLRRSEEIYRVTFENTGSATVLIEDDTIISLANTEFERLSGFSKQEIEGKKSWTEFVVKEDLARMLEQHRLRRVNKEAAMKQYEFRFVTRTGNIRDIALLIDVIPGTKRSVAALMDITEHKRAETELHIALEKYRVLFESFPLGISVTDAAGNILETNRESERLLGVSRDKHNRRKYDGPEWRIVRPDGTPMPPDEYPSVRAFKEKRLVENVDMGIVKGGGAITWISVTAATIPIEGYGVAIAYGDITTRKLAEQKLLDYQKQLKQLAAQLSLAEERERRRIAGELHDHVSQSLALAKIKLDSLHAALSSQPLAGVIEDISGSIEKAIQNTRTLTFDLSNPILYELGFEEAVSEWLNENVRDKHKINTEFQDDGQDKPLDDDMRALLFRNVRELLINIIKYANADKVRVSVRRIDGSIEVVVEDNGVGFDPVEVRTLASKRAEFGLFSIRESLEELGGHFEIESKPGAGCKATMTAPLKGQSRKKEN